MSGAGASALWKRKMKAKMQEMVSIEILVIFQLFVYKTFLPIRTERFLVGTNFIDFCNTH